MSEFRRRLMMAAGEKELPNYLCFTALEDGTFTLTLPANLGTNIFSYIEYSIDDGNSWVKVNNANSTSVTATTPTIQAGKSVYWRGSGIRNCGSRDTWTNNKGMFSSTGRFDVSGNICSYLYGDNYENVALTHRAFVGLFLNCTTLVNAKDLIINPASTQYDDFSYLFYGCTSLISAPSLKDITIANNIFEGMFRACSSLIDAPKLPSTTLASCCYGSMFRDCTSLKNVPDIPAKNLVSECFREMFYGCTALEKTPAFTVNSADGSAMWGMFQGCASLTDASGIVINGFTGTSVCQNMFRSCSNLVDKVPTINAANTTTKCFSYMFYQCSKLTTSPILPASITSQECYSFMFHSTKLNYIKMLATDVSASNALTNWMYGAPNTSTSIFVKHIDATWTNTGDSGVKSNWTVIYYDPALDKYYTDQTRATECDDHGNPI